MNRNILKWVLIAAVILGAAAYLILSETSSKKERIVVGHSKAFKIEPIEGITISAAENALDKDRKFKMTAVDDKTYDMVVKQLQGQDIKPLMVFELDAGLKSDEFFPGNYDVAMDLDKMGIPRSLQDKMVVIRGTDYRQDTVFTMYNSRVNDGKLTFASKQNSKLVLAMRHRPENELISNYSLYVKEPYKLFMEAVSTIEDFSTIHHVTALQRHFMNPFDHTSIFVQHESGDFRLHFNFSDTEAAERADKFRANDKAFGECIDRLEKKAHRIYETKVKDAANKKGVDIAWWGIFSSEQEKAIRASINEELIFDSLVKIDKEIALLNADPDGKLPQSIENIINQIIRANEYLNSCGFNSFNTVLQVALLKGVMDAEGTAKQYWFQSEAFVNINYSAYFNPNKGPDAIQCTLAHELCHVRQKYYHASFNTMKRGAEEATAVICERDAARLWYKQGILDKTNDPESRTVVANILTSRPVPYIFGYPFHKIPKLNEDERAYTMADAIEGIRAGTGRDDVTMSSFLDSYLQYNPFEKGWKAWIEHSLAINEEQFKQGWVYFGERLLTPIFESQIGGQCPNNVATTQLEISPNKPVVKLKRTSRPRDYAINTYQITVPMEDVSTFNMPNSFIYCKGEANPYVTFYWSSTMFFDYVKRIQGGNEYLLRAAPSPFYAWDPESGFIIHDDGVKKKKDYFQPNMFSLAAITTTQSLAPRCQYYLVALFAPDAPVIRKVKEDQIRFVMPKPSRELTKNKLITGAVVTYANNKGDTVTREVPPKHFGDKVKWTVPGATKPGNSFSLSVHWYYKPDENTTYVSPESKAETWGTKEDEEVEEIIVTEPKTNHWKQVRVKVTTTNSAPESERLEGQEFVSSDYRYVEFKKENDQSIEMTGYAAINQEGDERIYERMLCMDGTLTATAPPKYWVPGLEYQGIMEVSQDPYVQKLSNPFEFKAEITTSSDKACKQSRRSKTDTGRSSKGSSQWIRKYTHTFMPRHPEGDAPCFFTFTQTYTVAERPGSGRKATVTFAYDYEWVGEPEEETTEEEPEGSGCWRLVKVVERDENNNISSPNYQLYVTGSKGQFTVNSIAKDVFDTESYKQVSYNVSRSFAMEQPKKAYYPRDIVKLSVECSAESGGGHDPNTYCQVAFLKSKEFTDPNNPRLVHGYADDFIGYSDYGPITTSYKYEYSLPEPSSPTFFDKFCIMESAAGRRGTLYYYEWVEDEPEDITVERMDFVAYLPESPVAKHIDRWPRQIFYGHDQITTYKEGSGYRVVGVSDMKYGTIFDEDARVTYQDRMEITLDKDFNVIRGTFTWDLSYYSKDPYVVNAELGKYDKKLHLQFEKSPDDGKTHKYHYRIVSLDASTRVTTPKDEQFYVLTTGDLQYNWVESDGKDHYNEYGCTPNCTPMDCVDMAKIVSDKDHNVEIDLTIKKQKH